MREKIRYGKTVGIILNQEGTEKPSLEKIADTEGFPDATCKWDLYEAITGQDWWKSGSPYSVHPFDIKREDMDKIYRAVKKTQTRYTDPTSPQTEYYSSCFEQIDDAYSSGDLAQFKEAIDYLLLSIVCD